MWWSFCAWGQLRGGCGSGHRFPAYTQQRNGFRRARQKIKPQSPDEGMGSKPYRNKPFPPVEELVSYTSSSFPKRLVKPFFFTVGFTGCAFGSAAIWQYESLKSKVQSYFGDVHADWMDKFRPQKQGNLRKQVNKWWNSLSEGQRTVTGIIAANIFVFCLWKIPAMQRIMSTYFTSTPACRIICAPLLLSSFSHFSAWHLALNMYVLWTFSSSSVSIWGQEQFMAVYLSAGVFSSFVSYVSKMVTGRFDPSLGASGAIMTVLAAVCTKMPEVELAIVFLPMFTFTAGNALKAVIAMDTAGLVLGWRLFDHAAHLGGALFGLWYATYGHELVWKNREPLVKAWHEIRTRSSGRRGGEGSQ